MSVASLAQFVSVPVATLRPSQMIGTSLYLRGPRDDRPVLYRAADYPLRDEDLLQLAERGVKRLLIHAADERHYQSYLREQLASIAGDESIPAPERFAVLNEVARAVLTEAYRSKDTEQIVCQAESIAQHTAALLSREEVVAADLIRVLSHDSHTFTHSANVSYYSVLLARELGIREPTELARIASGGLLHDVGKLQIPATILTKPTKLSKTEFETIKRHPTDGLRMLARRDGLSWGQLMMVYQHHERMDGSGYPVGAVADEIHPWARLCAVADVFEALTASRPYRRALSTAETFEIMHRTAGPRFDKEVYECWKSTINKR